MTFVRAKLDQPLAILFGLMAVSLVGLLFLPSIPQDQDYHDFADNRTLLGIPNFWNVASNLPFIVIGAAGLRQCRTDSAVVILFLGIFLTGFGSSYYHWDPNDRTLFWDRLPMTLAFAAILALTIEERGRAKAGAILLWPVLAIGVFSLLLWRWTDDLRLYAWVQFFPFVAVILLFHLYPTNYTGTYYWIIAAVLYALAKLFELFDRTIFSVGYFLSGHTLKHLAAAGACFVILRHFQTRRRID